VPVTPDHRYTDGIVLFLADLHLDPPRPAMIERFVAFCRNDARRADAVYLLGDLFEVWIGDDEDNPGLAPVVESLAMLTAAGIATYFMAGNRDFLVGDDFLRRTGVQRIDDPLAIDLFGTRTVLCHGDTLCTDDVAYQAFRARVRTPAWQQEFLARPLAERRQIAEGLRGDSVAAMADKETATMDVNPDALAQLVREHGAERVIHGHTHRPARHDERIDGRAVERWVLGDWYHSASMLRATPGGLEPVDLGPDGTRD